MLFVAAANVLALYQLTVEFATENTQFDVQIQEETAQWGQFLVVLLGQRVGYLFAGKHLF